MNKTIILHAIKIIALSVNLYSASKNACVIVTVSTHLIDEIISGGKTSQVKPYTEIKTGDIIQMKKSGKLEIILSNFEKVILKKEGKFIIKDDLSIVNSDSNNNPLNKKNDKFSEDIARDMAMNSSFNGGASRGDSDITDKIKSEISEAEKIEDNFLKHTAMYYIYRKYNCEDAMTKEAKILSDMKKNK